jgi:aryl-alcohol dehydrogenase-like predicted oxidoreductase
VTIPGIKTPEQAEEDLRSSEAAPLTDEEVRRLRGLYAKDFGP